MPGCTYGATFCSSVTGGTVEAVGGVLEVLALVGAVVELVVGGVVSSSASALPGDVAAIAMTTSAAAMPPAVRFMRSPLVDVSYVTSYVLPIRLWHLSGRQG